MNIQESQHTSNDSRTGKHSIVFDPKDLLIKDYLNKDSQAFFTCISSLYQADEEQFIDQLLWLAEPSYNDNKAIEKLARQLTNYVRKYPKGTDDINELLLAYNLDTPEGKSLIALVEGLPRIPDTYGKNALIADKLASAQWQAELQPSSSAYIKSTHIKNVTRYLAFGSKVFNTDNKADNMSLFQRFGEYLGEPFIRLYVNHLSKRIINKFICADSMEKAKLATNGDRNKGYNHCFDLLAHQSITQAQADKNLHDYQDAIKTLATNQVKEGELQPSLVVKVSSLHPRYTSMHTNTVVQEVSAKVIQLIQQAREAHVDLMIDAESEDNTQLTLKIFELLYRSEASKDWHGLGITVKACSKRSIAVVTWLASLAKEVGDRISIRMIKGDDWQSEIKHTQQKSFADYSVWTRKENTDLAYLACAKFLLAEHLQELVLPQFATHNVQTIASIITMKTYNNFEIHQSHGIHKALSEYLLNTHGVKVRIHTPVSDHAQAVDYVVTRLIQFSDKHSAMYQLINKEYSVNSLIEHPYDRLSEYDSVSDPQTQLPSAQSSVIPNILIDEQWLQFAKKLDKAHTELWEATNFVNGVELANDIIGGLPVVSPFNTDQLVGTAHLGIAELAHYAVDLANKAQSSWQSVTVSQRSDIVRAIANLYEENFAQLVSFCQRETAKNIHDAIDEVRHAIDLCRFYADQAQLVVNETADCTNINGKNSKKVRQPRGTMVSISTCSSPLANFSEQIVASLLTGNTVVAKPAQQASLTAHYALTLMYEAGIPHSALQFIVGGAEIGEALIKAPSVNGVLFTGTTNTAQAINQVLQQKALDTSVKTADELPIFVARSGGQNAFIADSTADPIQVALDAVHSAFHSSGQHCGACRILCLQEEIADSVIELIKGYMSELVVSEPLSRETDISAVIDKQAQSSLVAHIERMNKSQNSDVIYQTPISEAWRSHLHHSSFVRPTLVKVNNIAVIEQEQFGPILHVLRYKANEIDSLIEQINNTGYRLSLGIHSRIDSFVEYIEQRTNTGNTYVNRDQLGRIAGVQPFGGSGLSGTAPQSGSQKYLAQLMKWVDA